MMQRRRLYLVKYRTDTGEIIGYRKNPTPAGMRGQARQSAASFARSMLRELAQSRVGVVPVDQVPADLHLYRVADGALVRLSGAERDAVEKRRAWVKLRQERFSRLRKHVDEVASNPLRWNSLTPDQQQAISEYRQALLDLPQTTSDPRNLVWPQPPE